MVFCYIEITEIGKKKNNVTVKTVKKKITARVSFFENRGIEASDCAQDCLHFVHPGMLVFMSSAQPWIGLRLAARGLQTMLH